MGFPVVMYGCESWTIKKVEDQRIDASALWYWRRLLRVPWTARRSNQSILMEINPEYSFKDWWWSWSSKTVTTWCGEPTHWKRPRCWERLRAKEGGDRKWDGWIASLTQWTCLSKLRERVKDIIFQDSECSTTKIYAIQSGNNKFMTWKD